jgi:hypothetical protein
VERFEVELDKLANVGYRDLPYAADYLDKAERLVARCDGMSNRSVFNTVDDAWADLRDIELRQALRELQGALLRIADAVRVVHSRYGGADESSSLAILNANQEKTEGLLAGLDQRRDREDPEPLVDSEEIAERTHEDNFVPWPFGRED